MIEIDIRGLSCPQPAVEFSQAIKSTPQELVVLYDKANNIQNLIDFAMKQGYVVDSKNNQSIIFKRES